MGVERIILLCFITLTSASDSPPQVHEITSDTKETSRVVREPNLRSATNQPSIFDYQTALQQDLRHYRYAQQQLIDLRNILERQGLPNYEKEPLRISVGQNWKVAVPKSGEQEVSSSALTSMEIRPLPTGQPIWTRVPLIYAASKRTNRKLAHSDVDMEMSSSKVDEVRTPINRQDYFPTNQVVYVPADQYQFHSNAVKPHSDRDLNALNALIGQHPNTQLEGLKRLLDAGSRNSSPVRPTPITEKPSVIPNQQHRQHDLVESTSNRQLHQSPIVHDNDELKALQTQLDAVAQAQAQRILAEAQRAALEHIEGQHRAINKAKVEAERAALAKIAAHNQPHSVIVLQAKQQGLDHPLIRPLKAEIVANSHQHVYGGPNSPDQHAASVQVQLGEQLQHLEEPKLEKVGVINSHSVTQGHHTANAYQSLVLHTQQQQQQQQGEKLLPIKSNEIQDIGNDHQYAGRYAFGYKIKDFKMGNDFGHEEKRDGKSAKGHYHVLLPDGRLQKVEYYADPTGYHAKVTYENVAHH